MRYDLYQTGEYTYPLAYGFVPNLVSYFHEDTEQRDCVLVVPGGAYCFVSPLEGELVAKKFYALGYHAAVLTYTTNLLNEVPLKDQPMQDLTRGILKLRDILPGSKIIICGFSAGAHLCGSVCVHGGVGYGKTGVKVRPDAAILSYPVITSGEKAHRGSFDALLGPDASEEELTYYSLEKQVTPETPPCFLWQTVNDASVPVENSYLFAEALRSAGIRHAHHVFSEGHHGLSLADEDWANRRAGEPYTLEQNQKIYEAIRSGKRLVSQDKKEWLEQMFENKVQELGEVHPEVLVWPELAVGFLKTLGM